jgi:hypothetical protein
MRLALALAAAQMAAADLQVGVARVDITPPPGVQLAGYSGASRAARGTLDPLLAGVITFDDGKTAVALVTLDLIFPLLAPEMQAIREAVRPAGIAEVIFVASHTHSGPVFADLPEWNAATVKKIAGAIREARRRQQRARVGAGWGVTQIGANRRYVPPSGPAVMWWRNETKASSFPVDPSVGVIRVDAASGRPLAVLVNYACHPVVFGPDNLDYSADFPGEMRRTIEAALPGTMAFFLQGAAGDINPYFDKNPVAGGAVEKMRAAGRQLGEEVVRAARQIRTAGAAADVAWKVQTADYGYRWEREPTEALLARTGRRPVSRYPLWGPPLRAPVTALVLNRQFAFVGLPGEVFVEFQMYLRAHSPLPYTYFLGYCNENVNYIPTLEAAVRGGYGADNMSTRIEAGAGEEMIERGLALLADLLGQGPRVPPEPRRAIRIQSRREAAAPVRAAVRGQEVALAAADLGVRVRFSPEGAIAIPERAAGEDLFEAKFSAAPGLLRIHDTGGAVRAVLSEKGLVPGGTSSATPDAAAGLSVTGASHWFAGGMAYLATVQFGRFCFATVSGDVSPRQRARFRDRAGCEGAVLFGGEGVPHSALEPAAPAVLVDRAIAELFRQRGWLQPAPDLRY